MKIKRITFLSFLYLALLSNCAINPVTGKQDLVFMSEKQEVLLGDKEHPNILKRYGQYKLAKLTAYVNRVGQRLATNSHRKQLKYHFTVLDSPEVNAFALPGGYIYITRGILAYLNSEAELAAVLGHEIGHVTARHGVRQYSATVLANIGFTLGSVFIPEMRRGAAQELFNVLGSALLNGYGREHELQADGLGAEYLARSGYDPKAMIQVIRVLKDQEQFDIQRADKEGREPRVYHGIFASHPDNDTRLQRVVSKAASMKSHHQIKVERKDFLDALNGMTFGQSESQGIIHGTRFYHKTLDFGLHFPDNWKIHNRPDTLFAVAPKKYALLQLWSLKPHSSSSAAEFLRNHFKLTDLSQGRPIKNHRLEGYTALANIKTPFGQRQSRIAVMFKDKRAYVFAGATQKEADLDTYDGILLSAIQSFHRLRDDEMKFANALRISLLHSKPNTRFAELAKQSPIKHYAEEQLRLLNAKYPQGEPTTNEWIKIVK